MIDLREALHLSARASLSQDLVYAGGATAEYVKDVFVGGRHVLAGGRAPNMDVAGGDTRVQRASGRAVDGLHLERYRRGDTRWPGSPEVTRDRG